MTDDTAAAVAAARGSLDTVSAALHRAARKYGTRLALTYGPRRWTFAGLNEAALSVAAGLLDAGLVKGDRVATLGRNSDAYFLSWLGCVHAGLIHVPVNTGLTRAEVAYILRQSGARGLLIDDTRLAELDGLPELDAMVLIGGFQSGDGFTILDAAASGRPLTMAPALHGDDLAQLQYTSGTTAAPKGAMMTHRGNLLQYMSCIHDLDYAQDDRCLAALPLYHTAQMHCFTMPQLLAGAETHLIDAPAPETVLALIAEKRITSFFAPPTVWIGLLRHPSFDDYDLTSLEKLYYGASIMPVPVLEELRRRLPGAGPYNVYGQSEIGPVATVLLPHEHIERPASAGRPVLNVETRIVDPEMKDVAPGVHGEIVHRSPQLLAGYWERPDEDEAAFRGGWFHSGDVGYRDEQGYIYVVDRLRDVINTGGVLVTSREVEEALFEHPAVSEAAVIALPDPKWIEAVTGVVVLRAGESADEAALIAHARTRLASHKVPKRIFFVDALPRNASGKILKRELRTQLDRPNMSARTA